MPNDYDLNDYNITNSSADDITAADGIQAAGKVSFNTASLNDYMTNEAYKTLRTNILFSVTDVKTIVITSCHENEGKSTISTELAKSLAEIDKKTLLIDADLRKSVMLRGGMKNRDIFGLSELLSGQAELNRVLYHTQHPNFDVIFAGHFPPNPVELIGSQKFNDLLQTLKKSYDYIIIDSPPLGSVIDAAVIAEYCDGALMVITDEKISFREAQSIKSQLEKSGCKILGAVLNETTSKNKVYYKRYYRNHPYNYGQTEKDIKLKKKKK